MLKPNPQCDSVRRRGLWEVPLGDEGGALMNGISALVKETPERFLVPFHHVRTQCDDDCL